MLWIPLAIGSYFFSALSATIDKVLLTRRLPSPITYAFYTGLLSLGVLILVPFVPFSYLDAKTSLWAILSGTSFLFYVYFLYVSLKRCDASRIVPIIGATSLGFVLIISNILIREGLAANEWMALALFALGGLVLAFDVKTERHDTLFTHLLGVEGKRLQICGVEAGAGILGGIAAALFLALNFIFSKATYDAPYPFLLSFIWTRLWSAAGALLLLAIPLARRHIFSTSRAISSSSSGMVVSNKVIGAFGFLFLNSAIAHGPIALVNSLKGLEYLFVFLFTLFLTLWHPKILSELFDRHTIILKLSGIFLISFGFLFLLWR